LLGVRLTALRTMERIFGIKYIGPYLLHFQIMSLPFSVKNVPFYDDGLTQLLIHRGPDSIQGLSSLS